MAESLAILGAVATCTQLAEGAFPVLAFIKRVREAPQSIKDHAEHTEQIIRIAEQIRATPSLQVESVSSCLKLCLRHINELQAMFERLDAKPGPNATKKFQKALKASIKTGEINECFLRLERSKISLALTVQAIDSSALYAAGYNLDGLSSTIQGMDHKIESIHNKMDDLALLDPGHTNSIAPLADDNQPGQEEFRRNNEQHWRKIQNTLYFPEMNRRREQVSVAHHETFRWVFRPEETVGSWDNFTTWLKDDKDVFWISGKPGSGKSTLMKYILQAEETEAALSARTESSDARVLSFFFWNAGSKLQKSLEGAFRALLFQALGSDLSLAPLILKSKTDLDHVSLRAQDQFAISWSDEKLMAALDTVFNQRNDAWYFLFLDALDECEDKSFQVVESVMKLAQLPRVKLCVSSRSWSIFESCLSCYPGLQLQQLTHNDIKAYVTDQLIKSPLTKTMLTEIHKAPPGSDFRESRETMAQTIVRRAEGVFLWVHLVLQDLCEAACRYETVPELRRRLRNIPEELEEAMKTLLSTKIDKLYRAEAARLFRAMVELDHVPLPLLALIGDSRLQKASASDVLSTTSSYVFEQCSIMREQLPRRTGGFLEVRDYSFAWWELDEIKGYTEEKVEFMHRSAYDLIESGLALPGWDFLRESSQEVIDNAILTAYTALLAAGIVSTHHYSKFSAGAYLEHIVRYTTRLPAFNQSHKKLLDGVFELIRDKASKNWWVDYLWNFHGYLRDYTGHRALTNPYAVPTMIEDTLGFATYIGLFDYVLYTLRNVEVNKSERATYSLHCVMERVYDIVNLVYEPEIVYPWTDWNLPDFIRQLFQLGADAHQPMQLRYYGAITEGFTITPVAPASKFRSESAFDLLLLALVRYGSTFRQRPITKSSMFRISDLFLTSLVNIEQHVIGIRFRFKVRMWEAEDEPHWAFVIVNVESPYGTLIQGCYKRLGLPTPVVDSTTDQNKGLGRLKVVEIKYGPIMWEALYVVHTIEGPLSRCFSLSVTESTSFEIFHHLLTELYLESSNQESDADGEKLENHILSIIKSRDPEWEATVDRVKQLGPLERQEMIEPIHF